MGGGNDGGGMSPSVNGEESGAGEGGSGNGGEGTKGRELGGGVGGGVECGGETMSAFVTFVFASSAPVDMSAFVTFVFASSESVDMSAIVGRERTTTNSKMEQNARILRCVQSVIRTFALSCCALCFP